MLTQMFPLIIIIIIVKVWLVQVSEIKVRLPEFAVLSNYTVHDSQKSAAR